MLKGDWPQRVLASAALALLVTTTSVYAQQPGRIRGEVEKADGAALSLKLRDGSLVNARLAEDARVTALVKATLADIKPATFIGIAGMPRPDDSVEAFSIHIPPAAQRGNGEGERPWDARAGSTMTNAYFVSSAVVGTDNQTLTVKYKDSVKKVVVTPATAIVTATPVEKGELKAGAQIIIFGSEKQPDGTILIKSMYVGRGITLAM